MKNFIKYNNHSNKVEVLYNAKNPGAGWKEVIIDKCNCTINVDNNPSFSAIVMTDHHARNDGDRGVYLNERLPVLLNAINKHSYDYVFDLGDSLDGNHSMPGTGTYAEQTALYDAFKNGLKKPIYNTIGNHDVHGASAGFTVSAAISYFGIPDKYYYKDFPGNWRMIFLYSMGEGDGTVSTYELGTTQTAWLSNLINQSQDKNVCILTHVPILSVSSFVWRVYNGGTNPIQPTIWNARNSHADVRYLLELCRLNPCIKICMSGHEHSYDECLMFNTWFMCMGSTSAYYWNRQNNWHYQYAGFNKMNFYKDGSFSREILHY